MHNKSAQRRLWKTHTKPTSLRQRQRQEHAGGKNCSNCGSSNNNSSSNSSNSGSNSSSSSSSSKALIVTAVTLLQATREERAFPHIPNTKKM
ncbi:hypothetical protein Emed_006307 [Eimeria media]